MLAAADGIVEPIGNTFTSVGTPVARVETGGTDSKRAVPPQLWIQPLQVASTGAINCVFANNPQIEAYLTTGTTRNVTVPATANLVSGQTGRVIIRKSVSGGNISWGSMFLFDSGGAPDLAAMSTTQVWVGDFHYDGTNYLCTSATVIG